ncbi:MAG: cyclic nucleotide-binding domain-containing protein [Desulfobacterales bacterium]
MTFSNIACFTIITSFTKSNFLNAIASSTYFINIYNQKPYFLLYGLTGISFVIYSCIYYIYGSKVSFERRIKHEMLAMLTASLVLYCIPQVLPGIHKNFLPAMCYFVVIDIFDELIIVQTWSLINYCINIRESKRYQYVFLLSGSMGALISGYLIIEQVPSGNQLIFLLMTASFSAVSYAIISYIFHDYRYRINVSISATKESLKTLLSSQKRYKIIRSIVQIVILIGVFNLLFKVLFDVQINAHYPTQSSYTAAAPIETASLTDDTSGKNHKATDPKTTFIGRYKASISVVQVLLQLLFVYFFAKLWFNGKVLYAYPLLLIPNLLFIIGLYLLKPAGYQTLVFWGTICACAINDLLKRVIFDSSYQLLMFSIPERLCNAIRMYSKLFFKPVFVIGVCAFFLIIPKLDNPMVVYTLLIIVFLAAILPIISRIPIRYVLSLRESIQRRNRLEGVRESLISYQSNLILDQYKIAREHHNDMFNYLYLLNLIRNSYTSELDEVLKDLIKHENRNVRFETVSVINQVEAIHLVGDLEQMCQREEDTQVKGMCLQVIAAWGPANGQRIYQYLVADDSIDNLKYNLTIVHRWGSDELQKKAERKIGRLLKSEDDGEVLAGIWLVGELKLTSFKDEIQLHFGIHNDQAFDTMLEALSKMDDLDLFVAYLEDVGFDKIRNYASLNKHLARFESRAFDVIFDMLIFKTRSKSFMDLEKCLRTLRFLPSQDAVDFLIDTLFRFPNPHVKKEALLCINRLRKADEDLGFEELVERLSDEIDKCRDLCIDYEVIASTRPDSLLLLELARKIEIQVWMIFQILDLLNPELKVMDSFFRIKWHSDKKEDADHTRAKSIEYLESIIKHENSDILQLLESIKFDDGLFFGSVMPPDFFKDAEDVYERIFQGQDYWLKLSAVWGMPRAIRGRYQKFLVEVEAMMPRLEKFHLIKDSPMLKGLSMMELMMFAEFMEIVEFRAADYVFKIGDPSNALYRILEGKAELLDENQKRIDLLEAPLGIGFGFIIRKSVRRYALKCIEDCRMIKISSDDFNEILELNPRIYKNIFEILLTMVDKDIFRL